MLTFAVFAVAFLYSCVGHAGASGYIAAMTLAGLTPATIKPTALALNILVASIATWQFRRAGHFSWTLFWPLALASVPCAFLGGWLNLPDRGFKLAVGLVLLFSAARFLFDP
ncbi:MAG: sulfite exporter TauE/SafE family protein, partial [Elusimicrobia bacterium]|nr:sulfite exporter TauE/SafE family protein [Elusimicrobiota bacterium]